MEATVKQEPMDATELEALIVGLCEQNPGGITDAIIQTEIPLCDVKSRVMIINKLLSADRIDLLKSGKKLLYKLKDPDASKDVKGGDHQEKLVYQIIKGAFNKGIWIRDIRYKSNLLMTQLNKILKSLETKKLIKAVKSVAASKKKVYMLYELEPDQTVTGGAWYSGQEFESEFVEVLNQQIYKFLEQKHTVACENQIDPIAQKNASFSPSKDVWQFICELRISKVELSIADIETILNTLIYDGKVEQLIVAGSGPSSNDGQVKLYRSIKPMIPPTGLMRMPCGTCPVRHQCHVGEVVSPDTCVYMNEWLDL